MTRAALWVLAVWALLLLVGQCSSGSGDSALRTTSSPPTTSAEQPSSAGSVFEQRAARYVETTNEFMADAAVFADTWQTKSTQQADALLDRLHELLSETDTLLGMAGSSAQQRNLLTSQRATLQEIGIGLAEVRLSIALQEAAN